MAAQLIRTMGFWRRGLRSWSASAKTSLPVPVSPDRSTVAVVGATCSICESTYWAAGLSAVST